MIPKLPILGVALVTALAGQASAHEGCPDGASKHSGHTRAQPAPTYATPVGYHGDGYRAPAGYRGEGYRDDLRDLRQSDLNRDGWVTMAEALRQGRRDFRQEDRDQNRVLTWREASQRDLAQDDRDRNGRISRDEREHAIRRSFARFDRNGDGVLARYELNGGRDGSRSAGWWR
jgi:hypothetical protein